MPRMTNDPLAPPSLTDFLAFVRYNALARQERFNATFYWGANNEDKYKLSLLCEQATLPGKVINTRNLRINGLNEQRAETLDYMGDSITLQFLVDTDFTAKNYMDEWMNACVSKVERGKEVGFYSNYAKPIDLSVLAPGGIPGEALYNWSPTDADIGLRQGADTLGKTAGAVIGRGINLGKQRFNTEFAKAKAQLGRIISPLVNNQFTDLLRTPEKVVYQVTLHECFPKQINMVPLGYDAVGVQRLSVTFAYKYWTSKVLDETTASEEAAGSLTRGVENIAAGARKRLAGLGAK